MEKKNQRKKFQTWIKYSNIGVEMASAIFLGAIGGQQLDKKLGNETPWGTIGLLFVGIAVAFYVVYKQLK
ncbi:MAG: AtpZ/AtpI family protein [Chitinophagales bacterium]|nr:AtpZ/AtpI family protein [Chitinophagales bacterium]